MDHSFTQIKIDKMARRLRVLILKQNHRFRAYWLKVFKGLRLLGNWLAIAAIFLIQVFPAGSTVYAAGQTELEVGLPDPRAGALTAGLGALLPQTSGQIEPAGDLKLSAGLVPSWMANPAGAPTCDPYSDALGKECLSNETNQQSKQETKLSQEILPGWLRSSDTATPVESTLSPSLLPNWMFDSFDSAVEASAALFNGPQSPGPGYCPAAANIIMQLETPPYAVSRGNQAGDVYTVTITNQNATPIPEISLLVNPNTGFSYIGGSASAVSSVSGTLTIIDPGTSLPTCPLTWVQGLAPEKQIQPNETITFVFMLATNAYAKSGQFLQVSLISGDSPAETCKITQENVQTVRGNLTLEKLPPTQDASLGDLVSWQLSMKNTGLGMVYGARFNRYNWSGLYQFHH